MTLAVKRYRGLCACGDHAWSIVTKGFVTFVSPEDAYLLAESDWCVRDNHKSKTAYVGRRKEKLHRVIMSEVAGHIDHRDRNGLNNRRSNLRPASHSQNLGNGRWRKGVSGFRGVARVANSPRWRAYVSGRHLGMFDTPEEAARAYDAAAIERFGEFATLNFPTVEPPPIDFARGVLALPS